MSNSYGYNLSLYGQLNPGAAYGETFGFNVDANITAAMDGGLITNAGAGGLVEFTFPDAVEGRTYAIRQVEDYPITLLPQSGDTIEGETDGYTVHAGETAVFSADDENNWELLTGGAPNIISPTYNVRRYGAVGDGVTDDTAAFQLAASKCTTRGSVIAVPETDDGAIPGYVISDNVWASLGTATNNVPGTVMELGGRLKLTAQQVLPGGARIIGRTSNNNQALGGSSIRAEATFPNSGGDAATALLRIGRPAGLYGWAGSADELTDGTMLEWVTLNGTGRGIVGNNLVGIYSTSMQERSGAQQCIILGTRHGVVTAVTTTGTGARNFVMRSVDAWILPTLTGVGFKFGGAAKFTLEKSTCVTQYNTGIACASEPQDNGGFFQIPLGSHPYEVGQRVRGVGFVGGGSTALNNSSPAYMTVTAADSTSITVDVAYASGWTSGGTIYANAYAGFQFSGSDIRAENLHLERMEYGIEIGHDSYSAGPPIIGYRTSGVLVDGVHGYNGYGSAVASHPPMLALARIRNTNSKVFDIELRRMAVNIPHGQTVLVLDNRNNVTIPMAEFHANEDVNLGRYYFGGTAENGAVATPIPVECDRFNQRTSDATLTNAASPYDDYALGRTGDLRINLDAAGGDVTITSFSGGFLGRKFRVFNVGSANNLILDHAAATGTAANRIEGSRVADITLAPGEGAELEYGIGVTAYVSSPLAGRWYATEL